MTTRLLINENAVRHALEKYRQAEPLGDNPLRQLMWVHQLLDRRPATFGEGISVEVALATALIDLIEQNLDAVRHVHDLPHSRPATRNAALDDIQQDSRTNNAELRAWSILYHRFVRPDLGLQIADIAEALGTSERHTQRFANRGLRRLVEQISQLEAEARSADIQTWLRLKLPTISTLEPVGRKNEIEGLASHLIHAGLPTLTIVIGPRGIGKTTLARHAVEQTILASQWHDLAWVTLHETIDYPALLALLAERLDILPLPDSEPAIRETALKVRLEQSRTLIVLDNAEHLRDLESQITQLGNLITPGHVLLLSNRSPHPTTPVHVLYARPLQPEDIEAIIRTHLRLWRRPQSLLGNDELERVYAATGGNPMAARLVAGWLGRIPIDRLLDDVGERPVQDGDSLFETLVAPFWNALDTDAQLVALAFSALPADGVFWHEIQRVCKLPDSSLDAALSALARSSLIEVYGSEPRYVMHILTRRFVEAQGQQTEWAQQYQSMLDIAFSAQAVASAEILTLNGTTEALSVIRRQLETDASAEVLAEQVVALAPTVRRTGQWAAWRDILNDIIARLPDSTASAMVRGRTLLELGVAYRWLGTHADSLAVLREAALILGESGDRAGQANAFLEIGQIEESLGRTDPAFQAYQEAAQVGLDDDLPFVRRRALNGLAALALNNGMVDDALELLWQAATTGDETPDGITLSLLGQAYLQQGRGSRAVSWQSRALERFREDGDLPREARAGLRLGVAYLTVGDNENARRQLLDTLAMMRSLGDALGQARLLNNLGALHARMNEPELALEAWQEALALQTHLDDRVGMAYTLYNIADLLWQAGQSVEAMEPFNHARELADRYQLSALIDQLNDHPLNNQTV